MTDEELFQRLLAIDPAQREQALYELPFTDGEQCDRLSKRLRDFTKSYYAYAVNQTIASTQPPAAEKRGRTLAEKYYLFDELGQGGMGQVWLAKQLFPMQRDVAIKLIKPGYDSEQVVARFEAERQALALMDHPSIAKVFDGGMTPDGRPYFVMELVKGVPITQYCDYHRLDLQDRIRLMITVCRAIHHAHQKGIIHRDIKPSNVLVTVNDLKPIPKVIDFGVAKAISTPLTALTLYTGIGMLMGTPAYMSPEQATLDNLDIDTRSDVYSLGVLIYELLTGSVPFTEPVTHSKDVGLVEMLRAVREDDPPRPSEKISSSTERKQLSVSRQLEPDKLVALLKRELDWIVLKALQKDRSHRYSTANDLAEDLQRYLDGEPVVAAPPSARYQFAKWYRRNRRAVITAAVVLVAILTGTTASVWQAIRATLAETRLRREQETSNEARLQAVEAATRLSLQRGAGREALVVLDQAAAAGLPITPELQLQRVVALVALSDEMAALEALRTIAYSDLSNQQQARHDVLTGSLVIGQKPEEARRLLTRALNLGLPPSEAAFAKGLLSENTLESLKFFEQAIQHDPGHVDARAMKTLTLFSLGRIEQAIRFAEQSRLLSPFHPAFTIWPAIGHALRGDLLTGQRLLEELREHYQNPEQFSMAQELLIYLDFSMEQMRRAFFSIPADQAYFSRIFKMGGLASKLQASLKKPQEEQIPLGLDRFPPAAARGFRALLYDLANAELMPAANRKILLALLGDQSSQAELSLESHPEGGRYFVKAYNLFAKAVYWQGRRNLTDVQKQEQYRDCVAAGQQAEIAAQFDFMIPDLRLVCLDMAWSAYFMASGSDFRGKPIHPAEAAKGLDLLQQRLRLNDRLPKPTQLIATVLALSTQQYGLARLLADEYFKGFATPPKPKDQPEYYSLQFWLAYFIRDYSGALEAYHEPSNSHLRPEMADATRLALEECRRRLNLPPLEEAPPPTLHRRP